MSLCKILIIDCNDIKTKLFQTRNVNIRLLTSSSHIISLLILIENEELLYTENRN